MPNLNHPPSIICLNISQSKPSYIRWNKYIIWQFAFPDSNFTSLPTENKHNNGSHWHKGPPSVPQEDLHPAMTQRIDSEQPPKQVYMLLWLVGEGCWPSKCSYVMVMAMHHHHIKGAFEGHRPSHPPQKTYRLLRGLSPINVTCLHGIWGWLEKVYGPQKLQCYGYASLP
jgi:hypothetical protein